MFRNKIFVRAHLPSPSLYHFLVRQLSLTDASSLIEIETLCWKLSRRWRLACFHPSPSSVFVIYQRSQTNAAARVVEELVKTLSVCNVGEEAVEVRSAILIARAVECWFRSLMLEKCWRCIGDSTFVDSTFAGDEENKYFQALEVRVQSEIDGLVFIVSPDVIWFVRDKITDLVASRALQSLHDGNVALVEKDRLLTACLVLPSLYNGHILGSDFFSQGLLKVKEVSSLETPMMQPVWKAVGTVYNDNNKSITTPTDDPPTSQNLHLTLDFRARKPALWFISANRMLDYDTNHSSTLLSSDGMTETTTTCVFEPPVPKPLNEVVQVATKPPSLSQSQTYQRGKSEASMKMKTKQHTDGSDVNSKVMLFHASGKLQSLTVSDLKCFLASKRLRVGGKKEELIQRVTTMLG